MSLIIGLNSGSSCDGIDVVLAEIKMGKGDQPIPPRYIDGVSIDWPKEVEEMIFKAFYNKLEMAELCKMDYTIGAVFAQAVNKFLEKRGLRAEDIEVIGVDGQQIYLRQPDHSRIGKMTSEEKADLPGRWLNEIYANGIVSGCGSVCAGHTNITTVTTFRPADHAQGGNGAPLMPYLDYVMFRDQNPIMTLNIGGIANVHLVFGQDRSKMVAFDTGPGNIMIDYISKTYFGQKYDKDGEIAAKGHVCEEMLKELEQHPYFDRQLPRSAWRTDFDADFSEAMKHKYSHLSNEDIMATYCAFTAYCIIKNIQDNIPESSLEAVNELVGSGGGIFNKTLYRFIEERLPKHIKLVKSDKYGVPPAYKEALKFATLAYATVNRLANNIPYSSHADKYTILGKIALAPRYAKGTD